MRSHHACMLMGGVVLVPSLMMLVVDGKTPRAGSLVPLDPVLAWQSPNPDSPPSMSSGRVTFRVKNPGSGVVRVLSTRSDCGCARPEVRFDHLGPGEVGTVDVDPTPIDVGTRSVPITLTTGSPTTPEVALTLRLSGTRRPPYLLKARGDLTFRSMEPGEGGVFDTTTVTVCGGEKPREPILRVGLPFLEVKLTNTVEMPGADDPEATYQMRTYRVTIASRPPEADFSGEILVVDPWNTDRSFSLHVLGSIEPLLRAIPPTLYLGSDEGSTRLTIAARTASSDLRVELEGGESDALTVERVGRADRFETFAIRRKVGHDVRQGVANLVVTAVGSPEARLIVPVRLGPEGER